MMGQISFHVLPGHLYVSFGDSDTHFDPQMPFRSCLLWAHGYIPAPSVSTVLISSSTV